MGSIDEVSVLFASRAVTSFRARYPWLGPVIWAVTLEYFVVQVFAAGVFVPTYDWSRNVISDLGAAYPCPATHGGFCSPRHGWMNGGFIVLGAVMIAGSILTYQSRAHRVCPPAD